MLIISYIGDHVWLMTSRQTEPDLGRISTAIPRLCLERQATGSHNSSMFGWNILLTNPMLGLLYGYVSGSSTCTFQMPPSNGAMASQQLSSSSSSSSSPGRVSGTDSLQVP